MKRSNKQSLPATKLFDHVRELRTRFFVCLATLIVSGCITYFFYEPILAILRSPLNTPLYYNSPAGSFAFVMRICLMGAITVTIPIIIYNLIMFIRPAFEETLPLNRVYSITIFSVVMAAAGSVFAYFCILPGTLHFFSGFQVGGLQALISADSYLSFVTNIIITFVIVFQIPLLIVFIDKIKPIPPKNMLKMEKWVILGSLIVAAIVPFAFDLMTCLFIALPIIALYNISIILVVAQHARIARQERSKFKAVIVKPKVNQEFMTEPNFSFDEIATRLISGDRANITSSNTVKRGSIDGIQRIYKHPTIVQPDKRFHNRSQQVMALSDQAHIISDIKRMPKINRVLA